MSELLLMTLRMLGPRARQFILIHVGLGGEMTRMPDSSFTCMGSALASHLAVTTPHFSLMDHLLLHLQHPLYS